MYNLLKCGRCRTRTVSNGRKVCDRCIFEARRDAAAKIARRLEIERAGRDRVRPKMPEIRQGFRVVSAEVPKPVVREWWEVSHIGEGGIRQTEKHSDIVFAIKRYNEMDNLGMPGLQMHHTKGNVRRRVGPQ